MLILILILLIIFAVGGCYGWSGYPQHRAGISVFGLVLLIIMLLWLFGGGLGLGIHRL